MVFVPASKVITAKLVILLKVDVDWFLYFLLHIDILMLSGVEQFCVYGCTLQPVSNLGFKSITSA